MTHARESVARTPLALLLVVLAPGVCPGVVAGRASGAFDEVRRLIDRKIADRGIPSICVAVAEGGEIVWEEAFGVADKEKAVSATPHTCYPVASIAKTITATSVMILAERGQMELDHPIQGYLGEVDLPSHGRDVSAVTVRHMLNHTSGLPLHYDYFYADDERTPPPFSETVGRYAVFVRPPGEMYRYTNLGYDILCHAVATVSGIGYSEFVRDEVFAPLGMDDAFAGVAAARGDVAVRYGDDGRPLHTDGADGQSGIPVYASVRDLVRFGMFHLKDHRHDQTAILSDEALDAMHWGKDLGAVYDSEAYYGLGWFFREGDFGYSTVWHERGMSGASTMLKLIPEQDIAVAVAMNAFDQATSRAITDGIIDALLPEYAERRKAQKPRPVNRFAEYQAKEEFTGVWRGSVRTHEGEFPVYMVFQEDGDVHVLTAPFFDSSQVLPNQMLWDTVLNNTGIMGERIYGWTTIAVPTSDTAAHPYVCIIDVVRDGTTLSGSVTATATAERMYFALSSYIELEKD